MTQLLVQYSYLQVLDFMTTLAFLVNGIQEGNPVVNFAIRYGPTPLSGLFLVKLVALGSGDLLLAIRPSEAPGTHQYPLCPRRYLEPGGPDHGVRGAGLGQAARLDERPTASDVSISNGRQRITQRLQQPLAILLHASVSRSHSSSRSFE